MKLEQKIGRVHVPEKPMHTVGHVYRRFVSDAKGWQFERGHHIDMMAHWYGMFCVLCR